MLIELPVLVISVDAAEAAQRSDGSVVPAASGLPV